MKSILKYGSEELNKSIDKNVSNTIDKVTGDYEALENKAGQIDDAVADYETAAANYNAVADGMTPGFETRDQLKSKVDSLRATFEGDPSQGNADNLNAAIKEYNDYTTALDKDYDGPDYSESEQDIVGWASTEPNKSRPPMYVA